MPDSGDTVSAISDVKFSKCLKYSDFSVTGVSWHEKSIAVLRFYKKHLIFLKLLIADFYRLFWGSSIRVVSGAVVFTIKYCSPFNSASDSVKEKIYLHPYFFIKIFLQRQLDAKTSFRLAVILCAQRARTPRAATNVSFILSIFSGTLVKNIAQAL